MNIIAYCTVTLYYIVSYCVPLYYNDFTVVHSTTLRCYALHLHYNEKNDFDGYFVVLHSIEVVYYMQYAVGIA